MIESAGNFEMALDLIQSAEDMITNELHNAKVCESFKQQLSDFKYRCTSSLEKECLNIVDHWIQSKIQAIPSYQRSDSYKQSFKDAFSSLFDAESV